MCLPHAALVSTLAKAEIAPLTDVRFWYIADIPSCTPVLRGKCLLLTQSGHWPVRVLTLDWPCWTPHIRRITGTASHGAGVGG